MLGTQRRLATDYVTSNDGTIFPVNPKEMLRYFESEFIFRNRGNPIVYAHTDNNSY